jgi:hypothetical protein
MDKRKNNGGNSTKSTRPDDKRKNSHKKLIDKYIAEDFDYPKLKSLMDTIFKQASQGDTKAATLFLNYVIGKPKETIQHEGSVNIPLAQWLTEEE